MEGFWARALFDYKAVEATELSVDRQDIVYVEEQNDSGWCLAKKYGTDMSGWLPTDYVEKCDPPAGAEDPAAAGGPQVLEPAEPVEYYEPQAELPPEPEPEPEPQPVVLEPEPEPEPEPISIPEPAPAPYIPPPEPAPAPVAVKSTPVTRSAAPSQAYSRQDDAAASVQRLTMASGGGGVGAKMGGSAASGGENKTCSKCGGRIDSAFVVAKERQFHADCFKCVNCNVALGGKAFIERDGSHYCENCYYTAYNPKCGYCNQVIKGQYISALGQSWHPDHFVCTECGKPFEGNQFHKHNDKPYCEFHFNQKFAETCSKCGLKIEGQVFEALDRKYHLDCFTCTVGDHKIGEGVNFHVYEDKVYCPNHFEELFLQRCVGCNQTIKGQYVKVLDQHFHPHCWKCSDCGVIISSDNCGQTGGKFYCRNCVTKKGAAALVGSSAASRLAPSSAAMAAQPSREAKASTVSAPAASYGGGGAGGGGGGGASQQLISYDKLKDPGSLPDWVDRDNREKYLSEEDFQKLFQMDKLSFDALPAWKKKRMKSKVGLF